VAAIRRLYHWAAWRPVTHLSNACHHLAAECGVTQQEAWIAIQVDGMVSLQHVTYTREYNSVVNNIAKCDYS
jgi:hypothetical protein